MSKTIQNEIERLETIKSGIIAQYQRLILAANYTYDKRIKELKEKCSHEPELSKRFKIPMNFCTYCKTRLS